MQQSLGFYSNLEKYSMHQLLNFKGSYQASKKMLCNFCEDWRAKRKAENENAGTHGGVTANHRDLIRSILRILPVSFDWIKENRPGIFKKCLQSNQLAIITTSKALRVKMAERLEDDDTEENDLVGRSTLFNLLDRLQEAGIIIKRVPVRSPIGGGRKSVVIYLNPEAIALYQVSDSLVEQNGEQAPTDGALDGKDSFLDHYNTFIQSNNNINNGSEDVDMVQPTGCHPPKSAEMVQSNGVNKSQPKEILPGPASPAALLWKTCEKMLYPGQHFNVGTRSAAVEMIQAQLEAAQSYVEQLRSDAIAAFCQSPKYLKKNEKQRSWYLNEYFVKQKLSQALRDAQRTAFVLVYEAIRMQAQAAERYGYNTYYPTVFLSADYGIKKYILLAESDLAKSCLSGIAAKSEQIRVKNTLRAWLTGFAFSRMKDGVAFAVGRVDHYLDKAEAMLKQCSFSEELQLSYYTYFRIQILALL